MNKSNGAKKRNTNIVRKKFIQIFGRKVLPGRENSKYEGPEVEKFCVLLLFYPETLMNILIYFKYLAGVSIAFLHR